ncbi:MAG: efflux RND transporter permease subunit [Gammaproteobacteria bacterium]|nr:efflux RND transporter permease subunit [Gammaproteobacteria bacterium]
METQNNIEESLNVAGKLARAFIESKLTVLIIIGSILFGLFAILFTPRTYNPEIIVPVVNISVSRPGNNSTEILNQVIKPLEALMSTIPGVDNTYGMAVNDNAMVTVRFKVNENEENSLVKIYNQLNSNMNRMPSGTSLPLVQSVSLYDVPLVTITLSSEHHNQMELREIANHLLEQLRSVPQVGKSWIAGSSASSVRVWLDADKLADFYIPLQNIKQALTSNNIGFNAGKLEPDGREIPLRVRAELQDPKDVGNIVIGVFNAKPVLLKQVARIEIAPSNDDIRSFFAYGNANITQQAIGKLQPAVTIAIARQKGSNGVTVSKAILKRLAILKTNVLPNDITISITRNYGEDAEDAVNTLIEHLAIAILAVAIILLFFLGWREASIVTLSIPLILFIVLGIGWISGQTINRITLFALILALGLLVDDSIVVIENIHRHMIFHPLKSFSKLIVIAANEIGKPTIIATFTVILALIPMAFVTGMMGPFMSPIPFNAPLSMLVSLIIAYTVVPYLAYRWLKTKALKIASHHEEQNNHQTILHRLYVSSFQPLMTFKKKRHLFYYSVLGLLFLVLLQPMWQFIRPGGANGPLSPLGVELKMLPDDNVNTFLLEVNTASGTALRETDHITALISQILAANKYVNDYQIFLGEAAPEDFAAMVRGDSLKHGNDFAQLRVNLINKNKRKIGSHQIAQELYASLENIRKSHPNARIKLFETPPGPPVISQMEAALYGPNYLVLRDLADYITTNIYPHIYGMINIDNSVTENLPEYQIQVDQNAAILSGFVPNILADDIQSYFAGVTVGSVHKSNLREPQNIILRLPVDSRGNITALNKLSMINRSNQLIPLVKVAQLTEVIQRKPIFTRDQHEVVYVTGEMISSSPVYGVVSVTKQLDDFTLPDGKHLVVGNLSFNDEQPNDITQNQLFWLGEMRLTLDVFRDLGTAFIVALLLIFLLLTGAYRSFMLPCIIMGAIPLTLIGVFPGHWLMGQPFTATSMIGVIALAGIVVRNSLLLIDFIMEKQKLGVPVETAVMDSVTVRLLPIVLTALAIIFGSSVMVSDPVFGGLAISLIFGAFASTTLTLYIIPLIYLSWWKRSNATKTTQQTGENE